eukprot:Skav233222  [mRNA]  locus=scaffold1215:94379:95815:+ [translate_table: standard]
MHRSLSIAGRDKDFKAVQDKWSERLISEEKFSDAVAILGPEGRKVPFIRAHLAALSEPLCAALYGEFKESSTREIMLKDISVEAFDVMHRSSHHLHPKLTPERAISALQAAELYLIDGLRVYCLRYLSYLPDSESLQAMTAALKMSYSLPKDLVSKLCKDILLNSKDAVGSPAFLQAHGSIIYALIQSDALEIDEEVLWTRLVAWSACAVQMPELLGPFGEACSQCVKRPRTELEQADGPGSNELAQQKSIVQMMSKHMRFAAMNKEFFFDKVRPWETQECNDTIMAYWLLGRKLPDWCLSKRPGMSFWEPFDLDFKVENVSSAARNPVCQDLLAGSMVWKPSSKYGFLRVTAPQLPFRSCCQEFKVVLDFSPEGVLWSCELEKANRCTILDDDADGEEVTTQKLKPSWNEGRSLGFEGALFNSDPRSFKIVPLALALSANAARLTKITIFKRGDRTSQASKEADNLSSKIAEGNLSE